MMPPERHLIDGRGATVLASAAMVVVVDEPTDTELVRTAEQLLFGAGFGGVVDVGADDAVAIARQLRQVAGDRTPSIAVAAATDRGVSVVLAGAAQVTLDEGAVDGVTAEFDDLGGELRSSMIATDSSIVLAVPGDDAPVGQWISIGVVAGRSVTLGRLGAPVTGGGSTPIEHEPRTVESVVAVVDAGVTPVAARSVSGSADIDFGSLVGAAEAPRTDPTAAYSPGGDQAVEAGEQATVLLFGDGRRAVLDAPVVVGRRPPDDLAAGVMPHVVQIDDRKLSRHHVTFRLIDGAVLVTDEASTNGTAIVRADGRRERCVDGRLTEVPAGATVDMAGVVFVTVERGAGRSGEAPC